MTSLEEKLQKWIVHETDGLCEGRMEKIPDISTLGRLTEGKNKKIWKYIINRVKSRQSVQNIRNILRLRRAQTELHHIYPPTSRNNLTVLKQEIVNLQEKVQFVENSIKSIKYYIFSVKDSVQKLKEEACILNQKCTLFELVVLNYHKKNVTLKSRLEHLYLLLSYVLRDEKIMHFQQFNSVDLVQTFNSNKINFELYNTKIKQVLCQISMTLENKLIKSKLETQIFDWNKSIPKLACCISLNDVVHICKELSRQSETSLKDENIVTTFTSHFSKETSSERYLQKLKFEHVTSYFLKLKIKNDVSNLSLPDGEQSNIQIILQRFKSPTHQEFLLIKSENESLVESIKCLEEVLADLFNKAKYLEDKNSEQRAQCKYLEPVMEEFYQKLEAVYLLLDVNQQTFLDIHKALLSSNEFIFTTLIDNITSNNTKFLSDCKSKIKYDFEMSMKVMEKNCLQPLVKESNSECSLVPENIWELITLQKYQNRQLICKILLHLKKELNGKNVFFEYDNNVDIEQKHFIVLSRLQNIINHSKITENVYTEKIKDCQKNLEVAINEWWEQKAQFIPVINCQGKSLKMWQDVLHVLTEI